MNEEKWFLELVFGMIGDTASALALHHADGSLDEREFEWREEKSTQQLSTTYQLLWKGDLILQVAVSAARSRAEFNLKWRTALH